MAKTIMNEKALANKIYRLETAAEDSSLSEEDRAVAVEEMDKMIAKLSNLPGGSTLLFRANQILEKLLKI